MVLATRATTVAIGVVVVVAAIIAVFFTVQAGNSVGSRTAAEVAIPLNAYVTPANWKSGYLFDDKFYAPSTVTIRVGESIRWTNRDTTIHTVTSQKVPNGASTFDSGFVDPSKTVVFAFRVAGEYEYFCTLHPYMGGKVQVLP